MASVAGTPPGAPPPPRVWLLLAGLSPCKTHPGPSEHVGAVGTGGGQVSGGTLRLAHAARLPRAAAPDTGARIFKRPSMGSPGHLEHSVPNGPFPVRPPRRLVVCVAHSLSERGAKGGTGGAVRGGPRRASPVCPGLGFRVSVIPATARSLLHGGKGSGGSERVNDLLGLPGRSSGPRPLNPEFAGCHVPARRGCGGHTKLPPLPGDPSRCRPARPPPGPRPCRRRAPPPSASGADQAGDHGTRAVAPLAPSLLASDQRGSDPGPHCEGRSGDTGTARGSGQQGRRGAREDDGQRLASASQHAAPKGAKATVPPRRVWPLQGPQATAGPVGPGDGRGPGLPAGTSPCNPSTRNPPHPAPRLLQGCHPEVYRYHYL